MPELWTDDSLSNIDDEGPVYADPPPAGATSCAASVPSLDLQPSKPNVKFIGAAPFALLMKQGNFWGSISIADLEHAPLREEPARAAHPGGWTSSDPPMPVAPPTPMSPDERAAFKAAVPAAYHDFADVFSDEVASHLPPHRAYDHAIDLEEGKQPPYGPVRY